MDTDTSKPNIVLDALETKVVAPEPLIAPTPELRDGGVYIDGVKVAYFSDPPKHIRFTKGNTKFQSVVEKFLETLPAGLGLEEKTPDDGSKPLTEPVGPSVIPQLIPDKPRGAPHLGDKDPEVIAWVEKYGQAK